MAKLIMMKGLPASGKSTRAKEMCEQYGNFVRVNRDLIREMLHFGKFSGKNEGAVVDSELSLVRHYLTKKQSVIVDDTNLNPKNKLMWESVAKECGATFEVEEINTSLNDCIDRDHSRPSKVGQLVIKNMALQYGLVPNLEKIVICDIDGTIANATHRLSHIQKEPKDWKSFFHEMDTDDFIEETWEKVLACAKENDATIIFVSGRPQDYEDQTLWWIEKFIPSRDYFSLLMRKKGDKREDVDVKQEIYDKYLKQYKIVKVFDDRPSVIRMWQKNGLDVEDCGDGIEF